MTPREIQENILFNLLELRFKCSPLVPIMNEASSPMMLEVEKGKENTKPTGLVEAMSVCVSVCVILLREAFGSQLMLLVPSL